MDVPFRETEDRNVSVQRTSLPSLSIFVNQTAKYALRIRQNNFRI